MGKKKGKTYHARAHKPTAPRIRLSQCMIVKNEEKNIERALGWAKGIAFEQIVVDTGSTDNTVELAEKLGARVYHFPWIDDFAAAKNHAIEQATGDWIAFLDADEYFLPEHAKKLPALLSQINAQSGGRVGAVRMTMSHLDDEGKQLMATPNIRLLRNMPGLHYYGAIHEAPHSGDGKAPAFVNVEGIIIYHTGYSKSAYSETNKITRNISMLRDQLEKDPGDYKLMCYLADSLCGDKQIGDETRELLIQVIAKGKDLPNEMRQMAFRNMLKLCNLKEKEGADDLMHYAKLALEETPGHYDYTFYIALAHNYKGDMQQAEEYFKLCEDMLIHGDPQQLTLFPQRAELLYSELLKIATGNKDTHGVVRYATLILRKEKYKQGILYPLLKNMPIYDPSIDAGALFGLLEKLYDLTALKDKLFTLKCAKLANNPELEALIYKTFSDEEKAWFEAN